MGIIVFLLLGRLIYKSYTYIGSTLGMIILAAVLTAPAIQVGNYVIDAYRTFLAKPYVERYMGELRSTFAEKITTIEFDDKKSESETLRYWSAYGKDIRVKLRKKDGTQLSAEDLRNVIGALPPAEYDLRVFIYYGTFKEIPYGQFSIDFAIRNKTAGPPYCMSNDYENKPCNFIKEFLVNHDKK